MRIVGLVTGLGFRLIGVVTGFLLGFFLGLVALLFRFTFVKFPVESFHFIQEVIIVFSFGGVREDGISGIEGFHDLLCRCPILWIFVGMVLLAKHLVGHPDDFGGRIPRHFEGLVMGVHAVGSLSLKPMGEASKAFRYAGKPDAATGKAGIMGRASPSGGTPPFVAVFFAGKVGRKSLPEPFKGLPYVYHEKRLTCHKQCKPLF